MSNPQNEWQKEESELDSIYKSFCSIPYTLKSRPIDRPYLTIIGPYIDLQYITEYLKEDFKFNDCKLPKFKELSSLGKSCLIINLNTNIMFTTEIGLLVGEWRRFYLPEQYADLVKELVEEAKRIKS